MATMEMTDTGAVASDTDGQTKGQNSYCGTDFVEGMPVELPSRSDGVVSELSPFIRIKNGYGKDESLATSWYVSRCVVAHVAK